MQHVALRFALYRLSESEACRDITSASSEKVLHPAKFAPCGHYLAWSGESRGDASSRRSKPIDNIRVANAKGHTPTFFAGY